MRFVESGTEGSTWAELLARLFAGSSASPLKLCEKRVCGVGRLKGDDECRASIRKITFLFIHYSRRLSRPDSSIIWTWKGELSFMGTCSDGPTSEGASRLVDTCELRPRVNSSRVTGCLCFWTLHRGGFIEPHSFKYGSTVSAQFEHRHAASWLCTVSPR